MAKFLAIYYSAPEAAAKMENATPEEKTAGMEVWMKWKAEHEETVVDFGAPVMPAMTTKDGNAWGNSDKQVSGYGIFQAESKEALQTAFKNHPHIGYHPTASIEVHEMIEM